MSSVSVLRLGKAVLTAILLSVLLLLLLAYLAYRSERPMETLSSYALAVTLVGAWLSSFLGARTKESPSFWLGILCAGLFFLLILLGSFFLTGSQITWTQRLFVLGAGMLCALIGAYLGTRRQAGAKRTRTSVRKARRRMQS
jgi:putative membrane protein (TIGR04086 family)